MILFGVFLFFVRMEVMQTGGDADCFAGLVRVVRYSCSGFCFCEHGFEGDLCDFFGEERNNSEPATQVYSS